MKKNILILDDDSDILFFCSQVFESMNFNVVTSENCNDIVKKVEDTNPDIILIDNWIPDIGGIKAIKILKQTEHLRNIPVILFSANSNLVALAQEAGADSYLKKPFDLDELEKIVLDFVK
jgi:DNA-binding NtrC family response regulator